MRGEFLSVVEGDVCTKLPIGLRRRTAAFSVARAVARGNLMILVSWVLRSTSVSKPPLCPALTTLSTLPVSQTGFARDNGRTLGNVNSIRDQAASSVLAGTLVITFSARRRLRHKFPPSRLSSQIIS